MVCNPNGSQHYENLFKILQRMKDVAGDTPLGILLIPDSFQLKDDLWKTIDQRTTDRELVRDLPQRRIGEWLKENDIPCLDLLPPMRMTVPMADGRRHLYHANDTHINARGNAVVAEHLAKFLSRLSKNQSPK